MRLPRPGNSFSLLDITDGEKELLGCARGRVGLTESKNYKVYMKVCIGRFGIDW